MRGRAGEVDCLTSTHTTAGASSSAFPHASRRTLHQPHALPPTQPMLHSSTLVTAPAPQPQHVSTSGALRGKAHYPMCQRRCRRRNRDRRRPGLKYPPRLKTDLHLANAAPSAAGLGPQPERTRPPKQTGRFPRNRNLSQHAPARPTGAVISINATPAACTLYPAQCQRPGPMGGGPHHCSPSPCMHRLHPHAAPGCCSSRAMQAESIST